MDYFSLTPAPGGQGHDVGDWHGGGGGGVLVDGQGSSLVVVDAISLIRVKVLPTPRAH